MIDIPARHVIDALLWALPAVLEAASVRLELDAPAGVVARVDGEKMRQVLVNLIENAFDAHGGRITAASPPGAGLEINVEVPLARAA